jgi:Plavaka transposase
MSAEYEVWFQDPYAVAKNMLANPDFVGEMDFAPYEEYDGDECQYCNLMLGEWA